MFIWSKHKCEKFSTLSYVAFFILLFISEMVLKHVKIVDIFIEYIENQVLDFIVVCEVS